MSRLVVGWTIAIDAPADVVARLVEVTRLHVKRQPDGMLYYDIPLACSHVKVGSMDGGVRVNQFPAPIDYGAGVEVTLEMDAQVPIEGPIVVDVGLAFA